MPKIREPGTRPQPEKNTADLQGQSNTAPVQKQQIGKPFPPGISGNPGGKPTGTRDVINKAFLRDFVAGWRDYGTEAIKAMAKNQPAQFVQVAAALLPKQAEVDVTHHYGVSDKPATADEWASQYSDGERSTAH